MKTIDIILFALCVLGLIYFFFDRRKYSSISVYHEKLEKLNELRRKITALEEKNKIANENTAYVIYDETPEQLKILKTELKETEKYIKNYNMYKKSFKNIFRR